MDAIFYQDILKLYELLNSNATIDTILDQLFDTFSLHIPYDRIGLALINISGEAYSYAVCTSYRPCLQSGYTLDLKETSLKTVISNKECRIINDYVEYYKSNPDSEPTRLVVEEGLRASIACPLVSNDVCMGVILFSSKIPNTYKEDHVIFAKMIATSISLAIEKNLVVDDLILASITGFAKLVEAKDSDTGHHIERMQNYSRIIAKTLSRSEKYKGILDSRYIDDIYRFSPLHDVGKVGIADGILFKPSRLSQEEYEVMKKHTIIGADILTKVNQNLLHNNNSFFNMGIEIALAHHEKFDGSGYPHGLAGEKIPLCARIVTVADVFDALTSKRVYKKAFDVDASIRMIAEENGKDFDPDVVEAFLQSRSEILDVYEKYKETGEFYT